MVIVGDRIGSRFSDDKTNCSADSSSPTAIGIAAGLLLLRSFCEDLDDVNRQADKIDFATIDEVTGDLWLTINDHLP